MWHSTSRLHFSYDDAGRQDSLVVSKIVGGNETLGIIERRNYDDDGQLVFRSRLRASNGAGILSDSTFYDARGKMRRVAISSAAVDVGTQTARVAYSGLGATLVSEKWNNLGWEAEQFRTTAMGEVRRSRYDRGAPNNHYPVVSTFGANGELKSKRPVRPYQDPNDSVYTDTTYATYDLAGNSTLSGSRYQKFNDAATTYSATKNYYGADNRLVVVQRYQVNAGARSGAWEEFRYDALGRRVLSRSRRLQNVGDPTVVLCSGGACPAYVERTVWDGDQVLYELRTDGADNLSLAQLDLLVGVGTSLGKAGYVHAGGIDKPLVTMDGRVPHYNWRGLAESSSWTDGTPADCALQAPNCTTIAWPASNGIYLTPPPSGSGGSGSTPQWIGTVMADGAGSTGMLYRRNRFYDPGTGQFTQQDPIGIAGGANVYGFAGGDPINFSDPLGLLPSLEMAALVAGPLPNSMNKGGYVVSNALVRANVRDLYSRLASQHSNKDFEFQVTGGDRYADSDGNHRSRTDDSVVKDSDEHSPHLESRGARAVDLRIRGVTDGTVDAAIAGTMFLPANTNRNYTDRHTHVALPNERKYYVPQ